MSKYQAIVFDLDGTALPSLRDSLPSARLIETIARYKDKIHLMAATGRPLRHAAPILKLLGLTQPCTISGGTIIINPASLEVYKATFLTVDAVQAIFKLMQGSPYPLAIRDEDISPEIKVLHPTLAESIEIMYISDVPADAIAGILRGLAGIPDIDFAAVFDWSGTGTYAINITHIDATKEHGVADILSRVGVAKEAAIGIGDGNNDLALFRSVGLKIAMGNATAELKAAADVIAPTVEEDGLADIIERYAEQPVLAPKLSLNK